MDGALTGPDSTPKVIITAGLHGSASTWIFNVVRELMVAGYGEGQVRAVFGESSAEALQAGELGEGVRLIWKTHVGGADFWEFVAQRKAVVLVSIRDPRDALVSMMQRFHAPIARMLREMIRDCALATACAKAGAPVFRYEDRFFDHPGTVASIAETIGLTLPPATLERIFADWRTESVRDRAARLFELPPERLIDKGPAQRLDIATQVHEGHIGDTRPGKWRDILDPATARLITMQLFEFMLHFDYSIW